MKPARLFLALAMIHFAVGVTLGGLMAVDTSLWGVLSPIHAELNPFGWLTMLIYGMTYAVLASFAKFPPLPPRAAAAHVICAETGVAAIALGAALSLNVVMEMGWLFQALAPLLFLRNIVWIVRSGRSVSAGHRSVDRAPSDMPPSDMPPSDMPPAERRTAAGDAAPANVMTDHGLLTPAAYAGPTDRVAQRGTSLALLCWIAAAVWMAADVLRSPSSAASDMPVGVQSLVYYGWISGTVLAVSLHLLPRFAGKASVGRRQSSLIQAVWIAGVALASIASDSGGAIGRIGVGLIGLALVWNASLYVWQMRRGWFHRLGATSGAAWVASWCFSWVLGARLLWGFNPLSLVSLHLMFLGWITTLVYGVGYTLFPRVLRRNVRHGWAAPTQMAASIIGAALMPVGFSLIDRGSAAGTGILAVGGVFAGLGALSFIVIWSASKREGDTA
ncbi:MAG: hypothetical protein ACYCVB_08345 [Bacilli bacterium]